MSKIFEKFDLTGKVGLITGGAGFLGIEHAAAPLESGASVVLTDVDEINLSIAKENLLKGVEPSRLMTQVMDVSKPKSIKSVAKESEKKVCETKEEDSSLLTDLGLGRMITNFIVSLGQDPILVDRNISEFFSGYAHLYSYVFHTLNVILSKLGFNNILQKGFCDSSIEEFLSR